MTRYYVAAALYICGVSLRFWAMFHMVKYSGLKPPLLWLVVPPVNVVTSGPYRFLRHPLYLGAVLWMAGVGIAALGWGGAVLPVIAWPFYKDRMLREAILCAETAARKQEAQAEG